MSRTCQHVDRNCHIHKTPLELSRTLDRAVDSLAHYSPDYISQNETWIAVVDATTAGFYSLHKDGESLWLDNLWILPEFMGQGVGKQLFQHAIERSRVFGASTLKIEADPNAQSFYEKIGARKAGEHHCQVDGQPRTLPIMEINL